MAKPLQIVPKITVYIVDDDDGMRHALELLLTTVGYETAAFSRAREFLKAFQPGARGCLVLDVRMPEMSGLELQAELNAIGCTIPVVFITGHGDIPMAVQAMKEGAFEFIQKPFRDQDILDRINHALHLDEQMQAATHHRADVLQRKESLTPRELQVMQSVVDGSANKVIAFDLALSERTVEIHRAKVMEKMGAQSVAHLVKLHLVSETQR
jgi:two-component system response regulator FixJ